MTLSNFLTEAAVNYKIGSGNPEKMLYDFYVLSFISTINLSPEKAKTGTFGDVGFQGGFLGKSDRVKEDIEYAQDVLLPVLKDKLIKGLFVSICAEIRHIKDRPQNYAGTPLATSKVFRDYYRIYSLMVQGMPKEFEIKRLREPKGAVPKAEGYKKSYQAATKAIKDTGSTPYEFVQMCEYAFKNMSWSASYGGKNWANICAGYRLLVDSKSKDQVSVAIDHAYDLEHNTGAALNKVKDFYIKDEKGKEDFDWMGKALDLKRDATSMNKLIERCSGDMKRLALQAMALSPINYMKKTPPPEAVMQQAAKSVGGDYLNAFNQGAPEKYRTDEVKPVVTKDYKKAPAPKDAPVAPFTFHQNKIYFDNFLKTYVWFIKPDPKSNKGMIVSLEAITTETSISILDAKIKEYKKDGKLNTYVALENDLVEVSPADKEALSAAISGKSTQTTSDDAKEYVSKLVPEAGSPTSGTIPTTFKPDQIYYDMVTSAYVKYKQKRGWNKAKLVELYATSPLSKTSLIKDKIEIFKKEFGTSKQYVAKSEDLAEIDQTDTFKVIQAVEGKTSKEQQAPVVTKAPMPPAGLEVAQKLEAGKMYFDSKLNTFVNYIPRKSQLITLKTVELYAVTSSTNRELLKKKLNYYEEFSNGKQEYLAKVSDLMELSKEQINKVKDVVSGSADEIKPQKKPDLNIHFPLYKIGDKVYLDIDKTVVGQVHETSFLSNSELYVIKVIAKRFETIETSKTSNYVIGVNYTKNVKYVDDLNPKYKVTDRVVFFKKSGAEGIIVQTPFKQDAVSNFVVKITKTGESTDFKKGEEIVVNSSDIIPLSRENASNRTNAIKKQSSPGNIPTEVWDRMSESVKKIFTPYKKEKNTSYVYFSEIDGKMNGLYGVIESVNFSEIGENQSASVKFRYFTSSSSNASFTTISEKNFNKLQDYKSAVESIDDSPLYNAPSQTLSDAISLKDYHTEIIGSVLYYVPSQQYVKVKAGEYGIHTGQYYTILPVAKTKFTPAYNTFNWLFLTATHKDLQMLSSKAQTYLTKHSADIVKELLPKDKPADKTEGKPAEEPAKIQSHQKEIPVHYISNEDFLQFISADALSSQSQINRHELYYDVTTKLIVKPITSKKQFGDASMTLDVEPVEKLLINYHGYETPKNQKSVVNKTMFVYVTDLHQILEY